MNEFEQRIAAIIVCHDPTDYAGGLECRCGESFEYDDGWEIGVKAWSEHLAKVIVAEMVG